MSTKIFLTAVLFVVCAAHTAHAQTSREDDKWWAAQRNIETAVANLKAYLEASPSGTRSVSARQQLQVLQGLTITSVKPDWVELHARVDWRVASVDPEPDKTRLIIEIKNRDNQEENFFPSFDSWPLAMIDSNGEFYPMLNTSSAPTGIKVAPYPYNLERATVWYLQGGRTISLAVDFAPLAKGVVSGQVQYKNDNKAEPAKFSLSVLAK